MRTKSGKIVSLDGLGGSGKTTQIELLTKRLELEGYQVVVQKFPDYESPTGKIIQQYLKGELGDPESIPADYISGLYALDRAAAYRRLVGQVRAGKIIILDRSIYSGLAYQGAHEYTHGDEDPKDYIARWEAIEHRHCETRVSDVRVYLSVDSNKALGLIDSRGEQNGEGRDVHEADKEFMDLVIDNFEYLVENYGLDKIDVQDNTGAMRDKYEIHNEIFSLIENVL